MNSGHFSSPALLRLRRCPNGLAQRCRAALLAELRTAPRSHRAPELVEGRGRMRLSQPQARRPAHWASGGRGDGLRTVNLRVLCRPASVIRSNWRRGSALRAAGAVGKLPMFITRPARGAPPPITGSSALANSLQIPCSRKKKSLLGIQKFPAPLRREFGCKPMDSLAEWRRKLANEPKIFKNSLQIPC